jgi:hypothetical protein
VDRLARLARSLGSSPGAQLVIGAIVLAIVFPATASGSFARLIAYGALGVGIAVGWGHMPDWMRRPSPRSATWIVLAIVTVVGVIVFWDTMTVTPDWQMGDWGPQHAVLQRIMPSLPGLDVPVWNHVVATGDAPLDLYPALTYLFTGHVALALGLSDNLPLAFMIVATLVHISLAVTTTAMAARVASRPVALIVGIFWMIDSGAISHGGTVGLFHWALLHSAFAHVFSMIAALGVLAALYRPRIGASVAIWLGTAVATAAHPAALITAVAFALALLAVALLASDVPPRRPLAALGHLAIGVALGATVWLPASERLFAYGQHYSNELFTGIHMLQMLMLFAMPITAYSFLVYAGYLGILFGMWTRRADVIFVTIVGLVFLVGLCDAPYLSLGLAPGPSVARLGAVRMMLLVRPFIYAAAAFAICALAGRARAAWAGAPRSRTLIAAAVLGVIGGSVGRYVPEYWRAETQRAVDESRQFAPDPEGRAQLGAWAAQQAARIGPKTWARALFEEDTHEHLHLTAETGLPTFHMSPIPDLLLRERIESLSQPSLARFNVRWVVALGREPSFGDPATERVFGTYHVREVPTWDGKFARVEAGAGTVEVVRLDDRAVEIEVTGPGPVLVALGMGYYPRWRAHHATGADEPVYAYPTIPGGVLHVVSAWVAPGRTTFTCDGPLPSDGDGRWLSIVAAVVAASAVVAWRRPRWRVAILRRLARLRRRGLARARTVLELGVPAVLSVLVVRGCMAERGRTLSLNVGAGVRGTATVEARVDGGPWETCGYSAFTGQYRCTDVVTVTDATTNLLNDALPSWAFITPSISASPDADNVEIRVTRDVRLSGRYWAGVNLGSATLEVEGEGGQRSIVQRSLLDFDDKGERAAVVTARVPFGGVLQITMVAEDTLQPPRPFLAGPPELAPPAISAIGR